MGPITKTGPNERGNAGAEPVGSEIASPPPRKRKSTTSIRPPQPQPALFTISPGSASASDCPAPNPQHHVPTASKSATSTAPLPREPHRGHKNKAATPTSAATYPSPPEDPQSKLLHLQAEDGCVAAGATATAPNTTRALSSPTKTSGCRTGDSNRDLAAPSATTTTREPLSTSPTNSATIINRNANANGNGDN
ncbi:unnamed protein product, partial [Sphacelaria rigidula]